MFNKRGVDAVVATVLIIMITVAAAAVIWAFVVPMIKDSAVSSTAGTAKISIETSGGYTTWDEVQKIARVQVKRGNDNVNLTGLDFNFVSKGVSINKNKTDVPQPNQIKVYDFDLKGELNTRPEKVTVAPITSSGVGGVVSQSDVIRNYSGPSTPVQNPISCVSGLNIDGKIVICTCQDLQNMSANLAASYVLGKDIDCSATRTWNSGAGFIPVGTNSYYDSQVYNPFKGSLDGQGFQINQIYINYNNHYSGLFGYAENVNISNLRLVSSTVLSGKQYAGSLIGYLAGGRIINVSSVFVNVSSGWNSIGGLIGIASSSLGEVSIINCYTVGSVYGSVNTGGFIGELNKPSSYPFIINNSYSRVNTTGYYSVGGFIGKVSDNPFQILNSYSTGWVLGSSLTGGFIGFKGGTSITPLIENSFWDNQTSGQTISAGGVAKTTAQMKTSSTFSGWSSSIWNISDGSYPSLR